MDFNARKLAAMASLASEEPDKSRKGGVDAPIAHLISSINKHPSYYTTSSCSGRISILQEISVPENDEAGNKNVKRKAGEWIFVSHEPADSEQVVKLLFDEHLHNHPHWELMVFRFEPFILALDCRDILAAQSLVALAISCGFRESGITSIRKRIMVALRCSIRMEVPIAHKGQMMVSTEYVRFLVSLANSKMETNKKRTDKFLKVFQEQGNNSPSMTKQSSLPQSNASNCLQGKQRVARKRLDGNHCSQVRLMEKSNLVELEFRQLKILSRAATLEEKMLISNNVDCMPGRPLSNDSNTYCRNQLNSTSKVFESKSGGHDDTCNPSSASQPQNNAAGLCDCSLGTSICEDQHFGNPEVSGTYSESILMAVKMKIVGEPLQKLYRWGHSTCVADFISCKSLLIFGGYGGPGRHSRQNDVLALDTESGSLEIINAGGSPSPRMGHTSSMVRQCMFIICGREDPTRILSDVWVLDMAELKWYPLKSTGIAIPARWERLGDMGVLPMNSFKDNSWHFLGKELWVTVARSLGVRRLARQGRIAPTGTRDSTLELLLGDTAWVEHRENGILYCFDATKCMFSSGNISEKLRIAQMDCRSEIVVDLFAGIGYFVLPFLLKAKAKLVYACEWNPNALVALRHNIAVNCVEDRCIILEGDNRSTSPKGVADRVCLGLLPSSESSWSTAVRALRPEGGMLHVHGNVKDSEESAWLENLTQSIHDFACTEGYRWEVRIDHVERVKWYAPHIRHLVADVRCKRMQFLNH